MIEISSVESEKQTFIQSNQVAHVYNNATPSSIGIIIITISVWLGFEEHLPATFLNGWMLVMLFVAASRLLLKKQFKASYMLDDTPIWGRKFAINTAIAGLGWGLLSLSFLVVDDPAYQTAIVLILLGVLGASVPLLYSFLPAFISSSLLSALILPVMLFTQYNDSGQLLTIALILFIVLLYYITFTSHKNFINTCALEYDKNKLLNSLRDEVKNREKIQEKLEFNQKNLESIVGERTEQLQQRNLELIDGIRLRKDSENKLREALEDLHAATEELKQNEWFLDTIIENIPSMIFVKDAEQLRFVRFNHAGEELLGKSKEELVGCNDYDFFPKEQADYFTSKDRHVLESGLIEDIQNEPIETPLGTRILHTRKVCINDDKGLPRYLLGISSDVTERVKIVSYLEKNAQILEMIATGKPAADIYDEIALMYEKRHPEMRCSLLELQDGKLMHGGAPSMPKEYCDAVHGLKNGPDVGSCGTSTYTGKRVLVENIATDPKWAKIKDAALPHGMRCCWSEPIINSSGKVLGAFGMYYNHTALPDEEESNDLRAGARLAGIVMERDQAQKRIRELAYNDELTGLSSRARFYQNIEELIQISDRNNSRFGLLYIDLDDFKSVNDSLGHDVGDLLLKEISRCLTMVSRGIDPVARLSGDEFCILVKNIDNDYATAHVAQRYLDAISKPIELSGRKFTPACSIGIAHYPEDGNNLSAILKAADTSLYAAKERGKNQFAFYKPELTQKAEYRFKIEQSLREAVEKQQLSLVYQPQVKINTDEIIGVEALSRWNHPQLGEVPPTEFIAIAERIGMMKPLTEWVLRTACNQSVAWKKAGFPIPRMAVNISPSHFLDNDFVPLIKQIINETGMEPVELELEVTENVVQTDEQNLSVFRDLKALGILLAIDDFGTGYSSFASLKHLSVDCLKIDRYFIKDIISDNDTRLLIRSMIQIGHNLERGIIAEGVETAEQFNELKKLGCETAQGYLFSKPVSSDEVLTLLRKKIDNGRSIWPYSIASS